MCALETRLSYTAAVFKAVTVDVEMKQKKERSSEKLMNPLGSNNFLNQNVLDQDKRSFESNTQERTITGFEEENGFGSGRENLQSQYNQQGY